jgi:hypothetical protein
MPRIFDKAKLKTDCANCDAVCCAAVKLPYAHYPKPARVPCKHLDQDHARCTIFNRLEAEGFDICRSFDCYGAGPAVARLFREMGKSWIGDPAVATIQFHAFSIVYFELVKYLHPGRAIEMDVPAEVLAELTPFTEAALELLAASADPFQELKND